MDNNMKKWYNVKLTLMKNRREELCDISNNYIDEIVINWQETNTMSLTIPSHVFHNGETIEFPLFYLIKGGQQLILEVNNKKYKFIVNNIQEDKTKKVSTKKVSCYEYQKKLEKQDFIIGEAVLTRQLYRSKDEEVEIADGVLNLFEKQCQGWKVGHVDQKAMQELTMTYPSFKENLYNNLTINPVSNAGLLFDKTISVGDGQTPLNMSIMWDISVFDAQDKLYINTKHEHKFTNLPYQIAKIVANHYSDEQYFYGIKYTVTYVNGHTGEFKYNFVNCRGLKLVANTIDIVYESGQLEENWVTKYRSFNTQVCSWTSFLQQIEQAFECVITFDSFNQTINVYDQEECGFATGLELSYDNVLKEISKTKDMGEVVTKLNVESSNVSIASYNPLGTNYLENYDYYITNDIMSEELKSSMIDYKKLLEVKNVEYKTILLEKSKVNQALTLKNSQLKSLEGKYTTENAILSAYIKSKDETNQAKQQAIVVEIEKQISATLQEIQKLKDSNANYETQMVQIATDINKTNATWDGRKLFNEELLLELSDYTYESTITNDTYLTGSGLYGYAVKKMEQFQKPTIEFNITASFDLFRRIINKDGFSDLIYVGGKYELVDEEITDGSNQVMLYQFKLNPSKETITDFKFTNKREEPETTMRKIQKVSQTSNITKSMTDFYKTTLQEAKNNMVDVNKFLQDGLDLAAQQIRQRKGNNLIDMTEAGIFLIDADDVNNQIALINNLIAMTTDRWKTSRVAISPDGIIAEQLIGKVILGEQLFIGNGNNTFKIMPEGLYVYDQNSSQELRVFLGIKNGKAKLELYSSNGDKSLVLSEEGIYNCYQISERDSFDYYKPFETSFFIPKTLKDTFEAKLIVSLDNFRAYSKAANSTKINLTTTGGTGNINVSLSGVSSTASGVVVTGGGTAVAWGHGGKMTSRPYGQDGDSSNIHLESHTHWVELLHSHGVTLSTNSHSHSVSLSGSAKADTHSHSISMPSHAHDLVYGIYENGDIPECEVYLGGSTGAHKVATLNNSNRFAIIDVKNQFKMLGTNQVHKVIIKTTNPKGLARASFTLFWGGFYNYY